MTSRDINWGYWRTFLAVLDTGSLSGAARRLSLTQPTIGRHIENLEYALNLPLFVRSQNGLEPTPLALSLEPKAQAMAMSAYALTRRAKTGPVELEGTVRITASEIVGTEILPDILCGFGDKNPRVDLELALSNDQADLLHQDADIAVRMVRPRQTRLLAKKIGKVKLGLYAHRSYLQKCPAPLDIAELEDHHLIGIDRDTERWAGVTLGKNQIMSDDLYFRCDSDIGQLAAVRSGLGIGVCQKAIAKKNLSLRAVLANEVEFELEMWVVMHEDLKAHKCARAIFDHFVNELPKAIK